MPLPSVGLIKSEGGPNSHCVDTFLGSISFHNQKNLDIARVVLIYQFDSEAYVQLCT